MKRLHSLIHTSSISFLAAQAAHSQAIKLGTISCLYTTNNIISAYTKCRKLDLAHQLFDEMSHRDIVSWNTLISGYVNSGDLEASWGVFTSMRRCGLVFDGHTFGSMLKGVACDRELELGRQLHSIVIKMGFSGNLFSGSALLDMYAKCGSINDAHVVFQWMPERNHVSWNALIAGYSQVGDHGMSFWVLRCMELEGVGIDDGTISPFLTLLDCFEFYSLAMQLHGKIVKHGLESFNTVCNAIITAYAECGSLLDAKRVFDAATVCRDLVTWNSMIAAYMKHQKEDLAFKVFIDMQNFGFVPDVYTYTEIVSACSAQNIKSHGKCLHGLVIKRGFEKSVPVSNALITMYIRINSRCMEDATKIFFSMDLKDCCTWNSILAGYSQVGSNEDVLRLFVQMRFLAIQIDDYTFSAVIRSCSDLATLQLGQQVHVLAVKVGFDTNKYVASSLIFMYSKCGVIEDARKSFDATSKDNAIVWNSIIFGHAQHGQGSVALDLFYLMRERKVKPDHITFVAVLTACSHSALVEEGRSFIKSMEFDFGIPPRMEHYACAVDLYGRARHLEKAKSLVESMPFEPDAMVLKTLLGACRICGDIELAIGVAKILLELEPEDHCTYVLLSDMYGRLKMWDEKASVTRLMRERGVKKVPGWSWIEVKNKVHAFNAEDHSHPQCDEIYLLLHQLKEETKLFNYLDNQTVLVPSCLISQIL
ncbi:putative pentatricopeptide repeat-containing protein At3g25970 [Arachis duranensis]|uniref:Pentatricopeptide repeat-containing protein At3g25970 n=1 Tax=Arachis duranensis TaxID=130453 RepID=A0A6P4D1Y3_ARADU|nr:putative pentatricopeptide repeat-containing protein At3g25970 [Arachis duranensis]XP_052117111.1 putative pentatricopeptide repeat-containing protein At3g25970 [Arachis duranensis]